MKKQTNKKLITNGSAAVDCKMRTGRLLTLYSTRPSPLDHGNVGVDVAESVAVTTEQLFTIKNPGAVTRLGRRVVVPSCFLQTTAPTPDRLDPTRHEQANRLTTTTRCKVSSLSPSPPTAKKIQKEKKRVLIGSWGFTCRQVEPAWCCRSVRYVRTSKWTGARCPEKFHSVDTHVVNRNPRQRKRVFWK